MRVNVIVVEVLAGPVREGQTLGIGIEGHGTPRMLRESRFWGSRFFTVSFTDFRCVFMLMSTPVWSRPTLSDLFAEYATARSTSRKGEGRFHFY